MQLLIHAGIKVNHVIEKGLFGGDTLNSPLHISIIGIHGIDKGK